MRRWERGTFRSMEEVLQLLVSGHAQGPEPVAVALQAGADSSSGAVVSTLFESLMYRHSFLQKR